jgi:hypothetical protein
MRARKTAPAARGSFTADRHAGVAKTPRPTGRGAAANRQGARGSRKLVLAPEGTKLTTAPVPRHIDNAIVKAIARAFRWREMLEDGTYATIAEIATAEKINESYVDACCG